MSGGPAPRSTWEPPVIMKRRRTSMSDDDSNKGSPSASPSARKKARKQIQSNGRSRSPSASPHRARRQAANSRSNSRSISPPSSRRRSSSNSEQSISRSISPPLAASSGNEKGTYLWSNRRIDTKSEKKREGVKHCRKVASSLDGDDDDDGHGDGGRDGGRRDGDDIALSVDDKSDGDDKKLSRGRTFTLPKKLTSRASSMSPPNSSRKRRSPSISPVRKRKSAPKKSSSNECSSSSTSSDDDDESSNDGDTKSKYPKKEINSSKDLNPLKTGAELAKETTRRVQQMERRIKRFFKEKKRALKLIRSTTKGIEKKWKKERNDFIRLRASGESRYVPPSALRRAEADRLRKLKSELGKKKAGRKTKDQDQESEEKKEQYKHAELLHRFSRFENIAALRRHQSSIRSKRDIKMNNCESRGSLIRQLVPSFRHRTVFSITYKKNSQKTNMIRPKPSCTCDSSVGRRCVIHTLQTGALLQMVVSFLSLQEAALLNATCIMFQTCHHRPLLILARIFLKQASWACSKKPACSVNVRKHDDIKTSDENKTKKRKSVIRQCQCIPVPIVPQFKMGFVTREKVECKCHGSETIMSIRYRKDTAIDMTNIVPKSSNRNWLATITMDEDKEVHISNEASEKVDGKSEQKSVASRKQARMEFLNKIKSIARKLPQTLYENSDNEYLAVVFLRYLTAVRHVMIKPLIDHLSRTSHDKKFHRLMTKPITTWPRYTKITQVSSISDSIKWIRSRRFNYFIFSNYWPITKGIGIEGMCCNMAKYS